MNKIKFLAVLAVGVLVSCGSRNSNGSGSDSGVAKATNEKRITEYVARFDNSGWNTDFTDAEFAELKEYRDAGMAKFVELTDSLAEGYNRYFLEKYGRDYDFMYYPEVTFDYMEAKVPELKTWLAYINGNWGKASVILDFSGREKVADMFADKESLYLHTLTTMASSGSPDLLEMMDGIMHLRIAGSMEELRQYYESLRYY